MTNRTRTSAPIVSWWTCSQDEREHAVTDDECAVGRIRQPHRYQALCAHVVWPGALSTPFGPRCRRCAELVSYPTEVSVSRWWVARLVGR